MIRGLFVLVLLAPTPPVSDRACTGLKLDRGSAASTLAEAPVGGGEVYLGNLCFETSGEVLGLGLAMSSRAGWGLALRRSPGFELG